jgi:hypothetical protein
VTALRAPTGYVSGWCGTGQHDICRGVYAGVDCACPHHALALLPEPVVVAVHCFFGCPHVVRSTDSGDAHRGMEEHYLHEHVAEIRAAVGWLT